MPGGSSAIAHLSRHLLVLVAALFLRLALGDPDARCPDYVADYAPLVWLHSEDPYKPSDLLAHLQHTTPELNGEEIAHLPPLDLDNLEILNDYHPGEVALRSNDDPLSHPRWLAGEAPDESGRIHNSTPCVVILVEKSPQELDAFYFYFYSYNEGPNITQVLEPMDRFVDGEKAALGIHFGNHVGDWEHNMVRFRDGKPVGIYYSQHVDGAGYDWDHPDVSKHNQRPIVYSARGSHANYPTPGDQVHNAALVDWCDEGQRWDPVLSAYFYRFEPETVTLVRLAPPSRVSTSEATSNLTSFFYFMGRWGDRQFPDSDPRQMSIPRFGIKRFESGPTGPRFKHLIRNTLYPNEVRKVSWLEWGIGVYMSWYPCCLKGWRVWVSITVLTLLVVGSSVGLYFGVRYGLRKFRATRSDYRAVHEEDILLDDWDREDEAFFSSSDDSE
ncbi:hypothetical protein B0I35DRAFT_435545 [Stachybotrys elegans]|uniref:Vacuolar protein sorting-associated protein 62 n=1 Tax=Stachybotrys elegans TaxID=80388 RepID=A0A8K0WQD2_9HYPO|nr:hypothetical protein B0I35DRAFT_435545 [Stachybotrys elegans]